jgi:hypothetical protein
VLLINGLAKVTNDPIVQGADPGVVIVIGSHKDRRNRESGIDKVSVEFGSGHPRHLDVGNQAGGFDETRGRKEIGCQREYLNGVVQRPHEPFHRLTKELIIFNNRDQQRFRHTASEQFATTAILTAHDGAVVPAWEFRSLRQEG